MFYKLNNDELERIKEVSRITFTDYELESGFIPVDSMMSAIEDLLIEVDRLEEKYSVLERDLEENYRPLNNNELYDISEKDFI